MAWRMAKIASALAFWIFWLVGPAWAELEICNDTAARHKIAIGYKQDGHWVSEGWWQLAPSACIAAVKGDLDFRFYYFRAESPGRLFQHDRLSFCTRDGLFTIAGDNDCARRGYEKSYFAKIDVGRGTTHYSQSLSTHSIQSEGQAEAKIPSSPGTWGLPFKGEAMFHGCSPVFRGTERFCAFVGAGRVFTVTEDSRTPAEIFTILRNMTPGTPVQIEGDWFSLYDNAVSLVLRSVQERAPNTQDQIHKKLQGEWYSVVDPNDEFTVVGSGRQNRYRGALTSMEYLSVMPYCGEFNTKGQYLYAWDSQGGTGLCYAIKEVSEMELVLIYLPRGTELRYYRLN